jgi:hypothetical protein
MCDFETSVSVWTHNPDPDWMERNAGLTDVRLVDGISRAAANVLVDRLHLMYSDVTLEIRDIHNVCVWASDESAEWVGQKRDARDRETQARVIVPRETSRGETVTIGPFIIVSEWAPADEYNKPGGTWHRQERTYERELDAVRAWSSARRYENTRPISITPEPDWSRYSFDGKTPVTKW